jgi:hypothetical protein
MEGLRQIKFVWHRIEQAKSRLGFDAGVRIAVFRSQQPKPSKIG